jgi:hypothetical protein
MSRALARNSAPVVMSIDFGPMIESMKFIGAFGNAMAKQKVQNYIANSLINETMTMFKEEADRRATAGATEGSLAHVYRWDEIMETRSSYDVFADVSSPLYNVVFKKGKKGPAFSIKFLNNKEKALRDKEVDALAKVEPSEHHFQDQATELESVNVVEKLSSKVSARKISGPSGRVRTEAGGHRLKKKRIVVLDDSGYKLTNVKDIRRKNPFHNNFTEFFMTFWTQTAPTKRKPAFETQNKVVQKRIAELHNQQTGMGQLAARATPSGSTSLTARVSASPIVILDKGKPITAGFDFKPDPGANKRIEQRIRETYSSAYKPKTARIKRGR